MVEKRSYRTKAWEKPTLKTGKDRKESNMGRGGINLRRSTREVEGTGESSSSHQRKEGVLEEG